MKLQDLAFEMVKQMTGKSTNDPQDPDVQIAFYYIQKAYFRGVNKGLNTTGFSNK